MHVQSWFLKHIQAIKFSTRLLILRHIFFKYWNVHTHPHALTRKYTKQLSPFTKHPDFVEIISVGVISLWKLSDYLGVFVVWSFVMLLSFIIIRCIPIFVDFVVPEGTGVPAPAVTPVVLLSFCIWFLVFMFVSIFLYICHFIHSVLRGFRLWTYLM